MTAAELIEFYSVGAMPMADVGTVGYSDGGPGRKDDTNFSKRRRWMDASAESAEDLIDGVISNDGAGSERDVDASWGVPRADRSSKRETFGMAGLPGGDRADPESPGDYVDIDPRFAP